MQTPEITDALKRLAAALPAGCGFALLVIRPADAAGMRQCHICQHNLDDEARELGAECLTTNDGTLILGEARN